MSLIQYTYGFVELTEKYDAEDPFVLLRFFLEADETADVGLVVAGAVLVDIDVDVEVEVDVGVLLLLGFS